MVSIREFQKMMHALYFVRDQKRGAQNTFNWLKDELEELYEALKGGNNEAVEEEFADVLAWLCSLANSYNVDLEEAVLKKYNYLCPKCNKSPCSCSFR
jgi:NTP pyrophosphatase (non-canonical NTP hydrolase)